MKRVIWMGDSLDRLREFSEIARLRLGRQLERVQRGETPNDFRPMSTVGGGVMEIRVRIPDRAYRVFYVARFAEAVYVLHCFAKKSQKTRREEIEVGRQRYRAVLERRQHEGYQE